MARAMEFKKPEIQALLTTVVYVVVKTVPVCTPSALATNSLGRAGTPQLCTGGDNGLTWDNDQLPSQLGI